MVENPGSDFWRCTVGSIFGLALAVIWVLLGFGPFVLAVALSILGGIGGWLFGRIFA